jgi:RNA polymerase sigma-70 factor (ECF subfamily)
VTQALGGSQSAFEQILRRYQRPVLGFLYRLTGDFQLAEDLAQETFVKAFRSLAAFDTTRRLSSWLFRIAHNTGMDALRKRKPTVSLDSVEAAADPAAPIAGDPVER